ncbi:MAG: alpha/beta hydrolase [Bacteroidetes bacterium MedPE-SWsnd-G2]|nr:MAG: alpha/beta hydrolase [Bacteroidetes bacterium MedPE-SWsnd-G2]
MTIEYKGVPIFFTDEGKGSAVVLLHGFLESTVMWKDLKAEVIRKNRVICIDLLGHGQSGCLGYIHTMEEMAEAVNAVISHLKIRRLVCVGHSMGGYVGLAFGELYADKLKGLCLMNSTARADSDEKKMNRDRAIVAVKENYKTFVRLAISNLFRPKNRSLMKEEINAVKEEALKTPLQGIIAALEGMKIRNDREILIHFSPFKKMMVIGKKDSVLSFEDVIEQTIGADIDVLKLSDGHMSHIENKEEFTYGILQFIEKC